ncbi:MAG: response regulator [Pseudomonadota bacterium]
MPLKLLIIDDEPLLLEIWKAVCGELNWECVIAGGGHAAIETLKQHEFDLVITDIRMPKGDGFVVLDYLHEHGTNARIYVCSGYIDDETAALSRYNIQRIIRKPFSFAEELKYFRSLDRSDVP